MTDIKLSLSLMLITSLLVSRLCCEMSVCPSHFLLLFFTQDKELRTIICSVWVKVIYNMYVHLDIELH